MDVIRITVSLSGDGDTLPAIVATMGEAHYECTKKLKKECEKAYRTGNEGCS